MHEGKKGKLRGFTLVEMMVSIAVFMIIVSSMSATFSSGFSSYGNSRELQRNLETAQYAMNTLAKYLRTSTVVASSSSDIVFYDYSSKRCIQYQFDGSVLRARWVEIPTITKTAGKSNVKTQCTAGVLAPYGWSNMTSSTGYITGQFVGDLSSQGPPRHMGRVTILFSVKKDASSSMRANMQTTVSLRDYEYVGNN